jgi:NAD(P)-dependent dehydrogenase (short-subunit alcohol dehydrogenase family)
MLADMSVFQDKIAIVTGGGSGIGKALCEALAREGAEVVVADIDAARAREVARGITASGGRARGAALDVRDAGAFRALVEDVARTSGRLDYLFNNAGIAVNGEVRDITLEDWNRVIDVDLHGVVHGVTAAYPIMVAQRSGHIVNTASLAGLIAAPGITSYNAAKHGVVGLSRGLRAEGADLGVRVSVVCPGFIDTPILTESRYVNLDKERMLGLLKVKPLAPEACAKAILEGVARNQATIVVTWHAKVMWLAQRLFPWAVERLAVETTRLMRKYRGAEVVRREAEAEPERDAAVPQS